MLRACNGLCIITTAELRHGDGSTIIIMPHGYQARRFLSIRAAFHLIASADLKGVDKMSFTFDLGRPFKPFEQLMGVLPAASMEHVPFVYRVRFLLE